MPAGVSGGESLGAADEVERLLALCLCEPAQRQAQALERLCGEHPDQGAELRRRFAGLRDLGLVGERVDDVLLPPTLGDFRPLERLGAGGMGVVFRAQQISLGREVALKLVRPDYLFLPGARERFRREIDAVAHLAHPGIVPVFAVGEERGAPYFAMELVEGRTLAELLTELAGRAAHDLQSADLARALARRHKGAQRATADALFERPWVEVILELVRQAALALQHAHERGVLHRDVKPSNLMVGLDGRLRLFDFGLTSSADAERLTRSGSQLGTLPYMSPEQVRAETLGPQADVYSLGATLYECLTLRQPFVGASAHDTQARILAGAPPSPRTLNRLVSREVEAVCLAALAPERARRYATAALFATDLANALAGRPVLARHPGPLLVATRWVRRHPAWSVGSALGLALLGGIPAALYVQQRSHSEALGRALAREQGALASEQAATRELGATLAREQAAREQERRAREDAEATINVLGNVLLDATPERNQGRPLSIEAILERGVASLPMLATRPGVQGVYLRTLGDAFRRVGRLDRAVELLDQAAQLERLRTPESARTLMITLNALATAQQLSGRTEDAERTFGEAIAAHRRLDVPDDDWSATLHNNLGGVLFDQHEYGVAASEFRASLQVYLQRRPSDPEQIATSRANLAGVLMEIGALDEAREQAEQVLTLLRDSPRIEAVPRAHQLNLVALVFDRLGTQDRAEAILREVIGLLTPLYDKGDLYLAVAHFNLGSSLEKRGLDDDALAEFDLSLAMLDGLGLSEHPRAAEFRARADALVRRLDAR